MPDNDRIEVGEPFAKQELVHRGDVGILPSRALLALQNVFQLLDPDAARYTRERPENAA